MAAENEGGDGGSDDNQSRQSDSSWTDVSEWNASLDNRANSSDDDDSSDTSALEDLLFN